MKRLYIPYNPKLVEEARENRKNKTEAEDKLWNEVLKDRQLKNYKFLRQKPLDNFIADFYCAELMLVIEVDGDYHKREKEYDKLRSERLDKFGIKVIRYSNNEIMLNIKNVINQLEKEIKNQKNFPLIRGTKGVLGGCLPLIRGIEGV
ncbi:MAG: endonuclease domain-containing protein [Candidatus Paceibacterota bacterium]